MGLCIQSLNRLQYDNDGSALKQGVHGGNSMGLGHKAHEYKTKGERRPLQHFKIHSRSFLFYWHEPVRRTHSSTEPEISSDGGGGPNTINLIPYWSSHTYLSLSKLIFHQFPLKPPNQTRYMMNPDFLIKKLNAIKEESKPNPLGLLFLG